MPDPVVQSCATHDVWACSLGSDGRGSAFCSSLVSVLFLRSRARLSDSLVRNKRSSKTRHEAEAGACAAWVLGSLLMERSLRKRSRFHSGCHCWAGVGVDAREPPFSLNPFHLTQELPISSLTCVWVCRLQVRAGAELTGKAKMIQTDHITAL